MEICACMWVPALSWTPAHIAHAHKIFVSTVPKGIMALHGALEQDLRGQNSEICSNTGLDCDSKDCLSLSFSK